MNHTPQDLRTQTLELIKDKAAAPVVQLIQAWLDSLDAEDLADIAPDSLAPVLVDGFTQAAKRTGSGCQTRHPALCGWPVAAWRAPC